MHASGILLTGIFALTAPRGRNSFGRRLLLYLLLVVVMALVLLLARLKSDSPVRKTSEQVHRVELQRLRHVFEFDDVEPPLAGLHGGVLRLRPP
jgi:hypothetical protein